jgi:hypothetical protein
VREGSKACELEIEKRREEKRREEKRREDLPDERSNWNADRKQRAQPAAKLSEASSFTQLKEMQLLHSLSINLS